MFGVCACTPVYPLDTGAATIYACVQGVSRLFQALLHGWSSQMVATHASHLQAPHMLHVMPEALMPETGTYLFADHLLTSTAGKTGLLPHNISQADPL